MKRFPLQLLWDSVSKEHQTSSLASRREESCRFSPLHNNNEDCHKVTSFIFGEDGALEPPTSTSGRHVRGRM